KLPALHAAAPSHRCSIMRPREPRNLGLVLRLWHATALWGGGARADACSDAPTIERTRGAQIAGYCWPVRNRSASSAAMHPEPADVTAWRYIGSATSPAAKTPGTLVAVAKLRWPLCTTM